MIYSLDPFAYSPRGMGSLCAGCSPQSGLGMVYSLDPFVYSPGGMGNLGLDAARQSVMDKIVQGIVAKGDNCNDYLTWVDTYTRLSQKDKSKETLAAARELASLFQQKYNECVERKAGAAVQGSISPVQAPVATTFTGSLPTPSLTPLLTAFSGQQPSITQVPVPTQEQPPVAQQTGPASWMNPKTLLMIGGGVLALGLIVYMVRRK